MQTAPSSQAPFTASTQGQPGTVPGQIIPGQLAPGQTIPAQSADPRQALLAQLHDVKAPEPVGAWPPAPGWWLIGLLLLVALGSVFFAWRKRYLNNRYRSQALQQLEAIDQNIGTQQYAIAVIQLLKRAFFSAYPKSRQQVSGVYGKDWLHLLNQTSEKAVLTPTLESGIENMLYERSPKVDKAISTELSSFARAWISTHSRMSDKVWTKICAVSQRQPLQQPQGSVFKTAEVKSTEVKPTKVKSTNEECHV